jgi:cholesterol transport system auxiliary component
MNSLPQYGNCRDKNAHTFSRNCVRHNCIMIFFALSSVSVLNGCGSLLPKAPDQPTLYMLDGMPTSAQPGVQPGAQPGAQTNARMNNVELKQVLPGAQLPTLTISTPIAAAGFGGVHIVYQRKAHELERFALNQWVDTPAQMLAPLIVRAVEKNGAFRGVVRVSTAAVSDFRLDTEIVRLQQNFISTPSETRLTLRAVLLNTATRRVVAAREFDASVAAASEDPRGGVEAANAAVRQVLADLAKFCAEAVVP